MNKNEEIKYIEEMIKNLNQSINNAAQFGDMDTVNAINNQVAMYQNRLNQLNSEK